MGIRFYCPNGHKLNVKSFQAGRKGICPFCGAKVQIPTASTRKSSKEEMAEQEMAPVQIIGVEPGEPLPSRPEASEPVAQPEPLTAPTPQAQINTPVAQPLDGPVGQSPLGVAPSPPAQTSLPTGGTVDDAPGTALPAGMLVETQIPAAVPSEPAPAAPADPLAESPNAVWYVRPPGGGQFGPAPGDVMRGWIAEGRVAADAIVWREGWRDWQEAATVFPQLAPDPTVAGLEQIAAEASSQAAAPHHHHPGGTRRKSNTVNTIIITVLVLAVIVLFGVFVWVLTSQPPP